MKKILVPISILFLLLLIGAWVYLMLNGAPDNKDEIFARLGSDVTEITVTEEIVPETTVDTGTERLKQLTTRPVGGAMFTDTGIRYMEQGTGHIYDIDLTSGESRILSGTTILGATDAIFSPQGTHVAITAQKEGGTETMIATLSTTTVTNGQIRGVSLPRNATEITFAADGGSAYYMLKGTTGATAFTYDLKSGTQKELFTIPLRDVHILWGTPTYAYTTPTATQIGHVFKITQNGTLSYVTKGGEGLVVARYGDGIVVTRSNEGERETIAITEKTDTTPQSFTAIPEKCVADPISTTHLYCAVPQNIEDVNFPDDWYAGTVSFSDTLWRMDTTSGGAFSLADFFAESGRTMDVKKIGTDAFGAKFYFVNKHDNTLWMLDRNI